jgi:hypothetical protein
MLMLAILVPPVYFLIRQKIGMFLITSAMLVVAFFLALTMVLLPGTFILWIIAAIAALRDDRRRNMHKNMALHADMIGTKVAEKIRETPQA